MFILNICKSGVTYLVLQIEKNFEMEGLKLQGSLYVYFKLLQLVETDTIYYQWVVTFSERPWKTTPLATKMYVVSQERWFLATGSVILKILLLKLCGLSRQVVCHGSGLSRQVSLCMFTVTFMSHIDMQPQCMHPQIDNYLRCIVLVQNTETCVHVCFLISNPD